ncbi:ribosome-associated translation inhibitor RaiA [Selenomonas sp. TAMA-11512]|uniref:ribosome hibernation-promoting factor, HPF/YfiA family n=1 Tax=Selenomonas sp. TAMA-11512 TaxID=3095337 RepID=UPI0030848DA8|nr:ribosome-associated translation inhibitor RaiA [Selenomonas sp. TAMA-11512]
MATFNIRGKSIEITPSLKEYVEKRVGKLTKYFDNVGEISVLLTVSKGRHIVEVTMPIPGGVFLRGEEATMDMYTSIDLVIEKLERQIRKQKTRLAKRFREGGFRADAVVTEGRIPVVEEDDDFEIVKTKRFVVKPMDVQEAIMQMNLLNHNFFVYRDGETEEVNVVYKRTDGKYGLIESGH